MSKAINKDTEIQQYMPSCYANFCFSVLVNWILLEPLSNNPYYIHLFETTHFSSL